ncbi:hypothetical protein THOM_2259 [Trachipleistophora hominis]|uniref:Uncharacterized protein n=1 Tax=Trachipleistophora hominis TaxID=72359 RepID=L7JVM0_TRAHO|nr:hypothetical protein THOM_2259 [Trachipleistophora hominis]
MRKLTEFVKRPKPCDYRNTTKVDTKEQRKLKLKLPLDLSFIIENYHPGLSLSSKLGKKGVFRLASRNFSSVLIKHVEKFLVYDDRREFNVDLAPFLSLKTLKIVDCCFFDFIYLTSAIDRLILDGVRDVKCRDVAVNKVELHNMDVTVVTKLLCTVFIQSLSLVNIDLSRNFEVPKSVKALSIRKCKLTQEKAIEIVQTHELIDFTFVEDDFELECLQNNTVKQPMLRIKHCSKTFYELDYKNIRKLKLYDTKYIELLRIDALESFTLNDSIGDASFLKIFLSRYHLKELNLENSVVPQTMLYDFVVLFKSSLRYFNVQKIEIPFDFLSFLKAHLRKCTVLYGNGRSIRIE